MAQYQVPQFIEVEDKIFDTGSLPASAQPLNENVENISLQSNFPRRAFEESVNFEPLTANSQAAFPGNLELDVGQLIRILRR